MFETGHHAQATQLIVQMMTTPPIENNTIRLGSSPSKITITAKVNLDGVRFAWSLDGPGAFEGKTTDRKIVYIPPTHIETESAQITITVTATADGQAEVRQSVILTLAPSSDAEIVRLLDIADGYFKRTLYTEPAGGENAFTNYKKVLALDPANLHASERIHRMAADYQEWGERAASQQDCQKTRKYYLGCQLLVQYLINSLHEQQLSQELERIQQRLNSLDCAQTPLPPIALPTKTPTPIPTSTPTVLPTQTPSPIPTATPIVLPTKTPTPIPTPIPKPTVSLKPTPTPSPSPKAMITPTPRISTEQLEEFKGLLSENVATYKALTKKEKEENANIQEQIIPVLQNIIELLGKIEYLYQQSREPLLLQKVEAIKNARMMFESELSQRSRK